MPGASGPCPRKLQHVPAIAAELTEFCPRHGVAVEPGNPDRRGGKLEARNPVHSPFVGIVPRDGEALAAEILGDRDPVWSVAAPHAQYIRIGRRRRGHGICQCHGR